MLNYKLIKKLMLLDNDLQEGRLWYYVKLPINPNNLNHQTMIQETISYLKKRKLLYHVKLSINPKKLTMLQSSKSETHLAKLAINPKI